jgi:putative transposase
MRHDGLAGAHAKRKRKRRRPDVAPASDRLNRDFTAERPNMRCVADLAQFPTREGPLHVAAIRDLCHRGIVGWAMDAHQGAELVVDAMFMALGRTTPDPEGLTHHSDRGSQYTSQAFTAAADIAGLQLSFGRTGDAFDTPPWRRCGPPSSARSPGIRGDLVFDTREQAKLYLFEHIEIFYNRQRHQTALGHMTPVEYAATFTP